MAKKRTVEFENSNLILVGKGSDTNGNTIVKLSLPNERAFSIQTNANLPKSHWGVMMAKRISDLSPEQIEILEKESAVYISKFGTKKQKEGLKLYAMLGEEVSQELTKMAKGGYIRPPVSMRTSGTYLLELEGQKHVLLSTLFERNNDTEDLLEIQDQLRGNLGAIIIKNSAWRSLSNGKRVKARASKNGTEGFLTRIGDVSDFQELGRKSTFEEGGEIEVDEMFSDLDVYARVDSKTGKGMNEGYVFNDGEAYFENKEDALEYAQKHGYADLDESHDDEFHYWTDWYETTPEDEGGYYTEEGDFVELMKSGGEVYRAMQIGDAVMYKDKTHYISDSNGKIVLVSMEKGAWGSDSIKIPVENIDIEKDVRDMNGNKVAIPTDASDGEVKTKNKQNDMLKPTKKNIFLTGGDLDQVMLREGGDLDDVMFEEGGELDDLFAKGGATLPRLKKGDSVTIIGKRWFQKTYGNTYHSVEVFVNNKLIGSNPFTYGYGDGYQQTGMAILQSNFKMPKDFSEMSPMRTLKDAGINVVTRVTDVNAKRELETGGVVDALIPERDLDVPFAKGGTVGLLAKIMETNEITEKEMNLLKLRMNSNRVDPEPQEIIDYIWNNDVVCDTNWAKKEIDFLKDQWKSPTGKERLNNPFGFRVQEVIDNFDHMELAGFYDISKYGGAKFFVPLYDCCDKEGYCFQYYYDGKISIVVQMGGLFGMISPRSKESWKRDRLWTSKQKHEQSYKKKRKSAIRNHVKDSRLDSQEIHEVRTRRNRK